jgi:gamma-D-glutamyl-L-lysine dipeptidyl-peptidase
LIQKHFLGDAAVVRVPVTPLTAIRSLRSEQVSQAILGTPVHVREQGAHWCRVETPDTYQGWVPRRVLSPSTASGTREALLIRELWANLRAGPDSRLPALLTAYIGTRLPRAECQGRWVGLELPGGGTGWVEEHRVSSERPCQGEWVREAAAILATAERFLGVPYLWGGGTPVGIDCSGFVQLVFGLHGLALRRDTTEQLTQGEEADFGALCPADLVFFGADGTASERVTHVGLMLDGQRFIHARGGQCVQIDSLAEEAWQRRLAAARRFL